MGYRIRLGLFPKDKYYLYENESYEDIKKYVEEQSNLDKKSYSLYYPKEHEQLYEIGKYVSYENGRQPFYKKFNLYEEEESEFDILTKEGLQYIIKESHKEIKKLYNNLFNCFEVTNPSGTENNIKIKEYIDGEYKKPLDLLFSFIHSKKYEWDESCKYILPYRLDEPLGCDGEIASSWSIEYAIFNLVYIYRTFDFEKNFLIYSGW